MSELQVFRLLCPEFATKTDEEVLSMMELARPHVSASRFGVFYGQAVALRAGHMFAMQAMVAACGSTSAAVTGGQILSEKEGDLQVTYAQSASSATSDDTLARTFYGRELTSLAKRCIVTAMNRMGG